MKIISVVFAIIISLFVSVSHAAILKLQVQGGILTGATNVLVDGSFYNVGFREGNCPQLYTGCDEAADFVFNTPAAALAAAIALRDSVFIDSVQGSFDSFPNLTGGCERTLDSCQIFTPYDAVDTFLGDVFGSVLNNFGSVGGSVGYSVLTRIDFSEFVPGQVYAVWTPVSAPSTTILSLMGIAGLLISRRRNQS